MTSKVLPTAFVVIEGPDGSGKTSISTEVARRLQTQGLPTRLASFPGKEPGTLGELVYRLHHDCFKLGVKSITPAGVQALHIAAHLDAIETHLAPAILCGKGVLVLDRYWWSTWVYGRRAGVSEKVLGPLIEAEVAMWGPAAPNAVFLVQRSSPIDRQDLAQSDFEQLSELYRELAMREQGRQKVEYVDNDSDAETSIQSVLDGIFDLMNHDATQ